jgi:hypothetical protein
VALHLLQYGINHLVLKGKLMSFHPGQTRGPRETQQGGLLHVLDGMTSLQTDGLDFVNASRRSCMRMLRPFSNRGVDEQTRDYWKHNCY